MGASLQICSGEHMKNKDYHDLLWKAAISETAYYYSTDLRNWVGNLGIAVSTGISSVIISFASGTTEIDWGNTLTSVAIGFLGWAIVIFFYNLIWKTPAKLYIESREVTFLRTWKDIELKKYEFPENCGFGVGIAIISHKPMFRYGNNIQREYTIESYPEVESIKLNGRVIYSKIKLPLLMIGKKAVFKKSSEILNQRQFSSLVSSVAISVANWNNDEAWLTDLDEQNNLYLEVDKAYFIQIEMRNSKLEDAPMEGCTVFCDLYYGKDKTTGEMKVSLENLVREPKLAI